MSTADAPVREFVHRLMNDERLLNRFRADPGAALAESDLEFDEEQRTALRTGDRSKLHEYLDEARAHFVAVIVVVSRN